MENAALIVMEASNEQYSSNVSEMIQSAGWEALLVSGLAYILKEGGAEQQEQLTFMNNIMKAYDGNSTNSKGEHHVTDPNTGSTYDLDGDNATSKMNNLMSEAQSENSFYGQVTQTQSQGVEAMFKDTNKADTSGAQGLKQDSQVMGAVSALMGFLASLIQSVS
ncbi:hypothetical protein [Candidatus Neptunochlamydia vexilliferae]|uniref:Uncharacterized protein n=1 Tax=Candidatus Neptunichlamydia vexilliferae TaxID=1651774 RepID=A0ABS0AWK6_9BACT|nr:hypothetical protein [Candidatus Neptunochlamydia vexilliferae]MBF5058518.1 hypothetical protein [Candidatus Neptunochlamydia vexilliferae]